MGGLLRVDQMYAFLCNDVHGEGVPAWPFPGLGTLPLMGADLERMRDFEPIAKQIASFRKSPVTLAVFSMRSDLKVIQP